jgi:hypothetical protein
MTSLLFYGDTERSAAMRHELPVAIVDPLLLAIVGGETHVVVSGIERDRLAAAVPGAILRDIADLAVHEAPTIGLMGDDVLAAGDVVAIEPADGCGRSAMCGSRICSW